jgi:hypothetical protein
MRLREPLNGFKLAHGHGLFHIVLGLASFIAVDLKATKDDIQSLNLKGTKIDENVIDLISLVRYTHLYVCISQFMQNFLEKSGYEVMSQFFTCT